MVFISFLFAILIPKIDILLSLFGSISGSTIALILPAILDLVLFWPKSKYSLTKLFKNIFILTLGIYIFIAGLTTSINDIVDYFNA